MLFQASLNGTPCHPWLNAGLMRVYVRARQPEHGTSGLCYGIETPVWHSGQGQSFKPSFTLVSF